MRHHGPPAPSREVWFHRRWAVERRWTLRNTNKTRNKIHLCKEIWELYSCATLVSACSQGHSFEGSMIKYINGQNGLFAKANQELYCPKGKWFRSKGQPRRWFLTKCRDRNISEASGEGAGRWQDVSFLRLGTYQLLTVWVGGFCQPWKQIRIAEALRLTQNLSYSE